MDPEYYCENCGCELRQDEGVFDDLCDDCYALTDDDDFEDDGQPSEYEEWQDLYGGDDRYEYDDVGSDYDY